MILLEIRRFRIQLNLSLTAVGIAVFALLAAWSTRYRWVFIDGVYSWRFANYRSESVVTYASIAAILLWAACVFGLIKSRTFALASMILGATGLVAALWVLAFVVGDSSYYLSPLTIRSSATFQPAPGLWMTIACCGGVIELAVINVFGSSLARQLGVVDASVRLRAVALSALLAAASFLMPWLTGVYLIQSGTGSWPGWVVLGCALSVLALTARAMRGELSAPLWRVSSIALSAVALLSSVRFFDVFVGSIDPVHTKTLIDFFSIQHLHAAAGLYLAIAASLGMILAAMPTNARELREILDLRVRRHKLNWPVSNVSGDA